MAAKQAGRLFIKITRESLPRTGNRHPFIYLEHGRLEVDKNCLEWLDADGSQIPLPVATLNCLLLGPGVSITHEAVKVCSQANCGICWVGEESLLFYAAGFTPTSHTRNIRRQAMLAMDENAALAVARAMLKKRFPGAALAGKTKRELLGLEGRLVKELYERKAKEYGMEWQGRDYGRGGLAGNDLANRILSSVNAALYGVLCAVVHGLGYSPHIGFIHTGSSLPFIYDLADLYKADLCVDPAFYLARELDGKYDRHTVTEEFRKRAIEMDLLKRACADIEDLLGERP